MKFTIDRIEEGVAVLISSGHELYQIPVPASLLPPDAKEGDTVTLTINPDIGGTNSSKNRVSSLIEKLKHK